MSREHRLIIRLKAEEDLSAAALFYDLQRPGLGDEFLAEVHSAIAKALENPFQFVRLRRQPEVRRVLTQRFPYRIFFIRRVGYIIVFRVLHGARHDREWKQNIPKD